MPLIRVTGPALADPGQRIAPERLSDLVGYCFEANGRAVAALCETLPVLTVSDDTHAVAIADVLEALALNSSTPPEVFRAWGDLLETSLVCFPFTSVDLLSTKATEGVSMDTLYVFIYRVPRNGLDEELAGKLLGLVVPVWSYLLIGTREPCHPWEDATSYSVCNDDIRQALVAHYGPTVAESLYRFLPVGQVTKVPVDCCEIRPCPSTPEGDSP